MSDALIVRIKIDDLPLMLAAPSVPPDRRKSPHPIAADSAHPAMPDRQTHAPESASRIRESRPSLSAPRFEPLRLFAMRLSRAPRRARRKPQSLPAADTGPQALPPQPASLA